MQKLEELNLTSLINKSNVERKGELEDRIKANASAVSNMTTPFAQRVQENHVDAQDRSVPHLTNLNEDEQLSGKLFYNFENGPIRIGRKKAEIKNQVVLGGIRIQQNHAIVEEEKGLDLSEEVVEEKTEEVKEEKVEEVDLVAGDVMVMYSNEPNDKFKN